MWRLAARVESWLSTATRREFAVEIKLLSSSANIHRYAINSQLISTELEEIPLELQIPDRLNTYNHVDCQ